MSFEQYSTFSMFLVLGLAVFGLWITARILKKAGFSPWWSFLILIPLVNLAAVYAFAFSRWPAEKDAAA